MAHHQDGKTQFGILEGVQWYLRPGTPNQEVSSEAAPSHSWKLLHKVLPWAGRRCWTSPAVAAGHRDAAPEAAAPCPGQESSQLALSQTPAWGWGSWLTGIQDSCFLPTSAPESQFSSSHVKWVCRSSNTIFATFAQTRRWDKGCEGGKLISFHHPCVPKKCFWLPVFDF